MALAGTSLALRAADSVSYALRHLSTDDDQILISRDFDMSLNGKYEIYVTRSVPQRDDATKRVSVRSNTIVIELRDP